MNFKYFPILILINYLILISNCSSISFNPTIDCITTPCIWKKTTNWVGNVFPVAGDDVTIDIGSKAMVTCNPEDLIDINFNSITVVNSILKVLNSNIGGKISNIQLNKGQLVIESPKVSVSTITGSSGTLKIDLIALQNETFTTQLSSITLPTVQIGEGPIRIDISSSTINTIQQFQSTYLDNSSLPIVSFTGTNNVGSISLNGDSVSINGQFLFNGDLNSNSAIVSKFGNSLNDTIPLNGQITFSKVSILTLSPFTFNGGSSVKFINSTIKSSKFSSDNGLITFDGSNTLNSDFLLNGGSSSLTVLPNIKQTNIAGSLTLGESTTTIFQSVGSGSPLITADVITINDGCTLKIQLPSEPAQGKYKLFKCVNQLGGKFNTISLTIDSKEVEIEKYNISSNEGSYSITFGSIDVNSSSIITFNLISLSFIILILNLFI